jgi:hypothetical protein
MVAPINHGNTGLLFKDFYNIVVSYEKNNNYDINYLLGDHFRDI